ncbi:MAG: hypothetical protein RIG84_09390 [Roseovarius sp.]
MAFRALLLAAGFCLAAGLAPGQPAGQPAGTPAPAQPGETRLSLSQAQVLAGYAVKTGRPELAFQITETLIAANPEDGLAHYLKARALAQLKRYDDGREAAKIAYRGAQTDVQRFEAAKLAAELSFADERLTASQLWLRRAAHFAPDESTRDMAVKAFRRVRYQNPFSFNMRFSVNPSDNVNNGANSPFNLIEGSPLIGALSPSAQAIPGVVATADIRASYRLMQTDTFQMKASARISAKRVRFNEPVVGFSGRDMAEERLELGLNYRWSGSGTGFWDLDLSGGWQRYGGDALYNFLGMDLSRVQKLTDKLHVMAGGGFEQQYDEAPPIAHTRVYHGFAGFGYALDSGGSLGFRMQYREAQNDLWNRAYNQVSGIATYTMGRQVGPVNLSFMVGRSELEYDRYAVIFPVRGGRQDDSWFGGVTATWPEAGYMGFVPTWTLQHEKARSNISRFNVDQTTFSFGIRSQF